MKLKQFSIAVLIIITTFMWWSPMGATAKETEAHHHQAVVTLNALYKNPDISISLIGDGTNTSHAKLVVTNKKTGQIISADLSTVCMSRKTQKPPPTLEDAQKLGLHYRVGDRAPADLINIVIASRKMANDKQYDSLSIPSARRQSTIAQLAIWQKLGGKSADSRDAINPIVVKSDLLSRAHVDPSTLSAQENSTLNERVNAICDAVDLTCKYGTEMPPPSETDEPKPTLTEMPDHPGTTDRTETPLNPEMPSQPEHPGKPSQPEQPGQPSRPDHPEQPSLSHHPGQPSLPNQPWQPDQSVPNESWIHIPAYTTIVPDNPLYQIIMITDPVDVPIPVTYMKEKHHCQGHRLLIIVGNPADKSINATIAWALNQTKTPGTHLMMFTSSNINSAPEFSQTKLFKDDKPTDAQKLYDVVNSDAFKCCCFYQEVMAVFHGGQVGAKQMINYMPYLLNGKPAKKITIWSCSSIKDIASNTGTGGNVIARYRTLAWFARPQTCACGCDGKPGGQGPIPNCCPKESPACPTGQAVKIYMSGYASDSKGLNHPAKLGIDEEKIKGPNGLPVSTGDVIFQSPDGTMREITVTNAAAGAKYDIDISAKVVNGPCVYAHHVVKSGPDLISEEGLPSKLDESIKDITASDATKIQGGNKADWEDPRGNGVPPAFKGKTYVSPCGCQPGPPCDAEPKTY